MSVAPTPAGPIEREHITGLILAGGRARRMNPDGTNRDKAFVEFDGRALIDHVIARLEPQVARIVINSNSAPESFLPRQWPIKPDRIEGFAGPLAGLHAGLSAADTPWVLTAPCDSPFLADDLAQKLAKAAQAAGVQGAVARSEGRDQPVFALVSVTVLDDLEQYLSAGGRKIDHWYQRLNFVAVDFDNPSAFINLNSPQDLSRYSRS